MGLMRSERPNMEKEKMKKHDRQVLFSETTKDSGEWGTPLQLYADLYRSFGPFTLDAAASKKNALCKKFFTKEDDAFKQKWTGKVWLNPPYGRDIGKWLEKAYESIGRGYARMVVCLVPARTDTRWWHSWAREADRVLFIRGRLKFQGAPASAPFPSAVLVYTSIRNVPPFKKDFYNLGLWINN